MTAGPAEHPRTLAAFYRALEQGQRIADVSRAAVAEDDHAGDSAEA